MDETEHDIPLERRPACDNCKARKTKCDRRSPCASCVTLNVACRTTRRAVEKRQRVLLSSKYDEAVQDVSRQLGDVKAMLQTLMTNKVRVEPSISSSSESAYHTPPPMIDEQVPILAGVREGYNGDSSFQSHARRAKSALEATLAVSELTSKVISDTPERLSPEKVVELLTDADAVGTNTSYYPTARSPSKSDDLETRNMPLPPIDLVLKLLRLAKSYKQRFFIDVPTFKEDEFIDLCRGVYFATDPISIWKWISANVGLYYLFLGANEADCGRMGTTVEEMHSHSLRMRANAEAAMQSLRLCSEPSTESCRALVLLGTFYVKEGHSTIAWRLISAAARAALDLGFHRLADNSDNRDTFHKRSIFWHIYLWDKGLAMTSGRPPVIHHYDVTTSHPATPEDQYTVLGRIYTALLDYSIVAGEIQRKLFSASALQDSQQDRFKYARELAERLVSIKESVRSINNEDPTWDEMFSPAGILLDVKMYSLLTIVYRILPPRSTQPHPLQCSDECVDAARTALTRVAKVGEDMVRNNPFRWGMFLNVILSLVPFVPFIVLAGNAIATSSSADLTLLFSVLSVLEPVAGNSQTIQKVYDACERFGRIASLVILSSSEDSLRHKQYEVPASDISPFSSMSEEPYLHSVPHPAPADYGYPMAHQDWDSIMNGFESELGGYDSRSLTNIMEPYIANPNWRFDAGGKN